MSGWACARESLRRGGGRSLMVALIKTLAVAGSETEGAGKGGVRWMALSEGRAGADLTLELTARAIGRAIAAVMYRVAR